MRTATIRGRRYMLHSDESPAGLAYGCIPESGNPLFGPAQPWLTDITDERSPKLVTQFGLEINDPLNCAAQLSSGTNASVHYHDVDDQKDTTFAMASMWNAGIRVFDVRSPSRPVEVAYFNPGDVDPSDEVDLDYAWGHIRWVPEKGHVWFASADGGFWVLELEPQVRRRLGLDTKRDPKVAHPSGRPARRGIRTFARSLAPAVAPLYCTLPVR